MAKLVKTAQEVEAELENVIEAIHEGGISSVNYSYLEGARAALEWVLGDVELAPTEEGDPD